MTKVPVIDKLHEDGFLIFPCSVVKKCKYIVKSDIIECYSMRATPFAASFRYLEIKPSYAIIVLLFYGIPFPLAPAHDVYQCAERSEIPHQRV